MPNVSKVLLRLGRKDLSIMGQAITGHNRLNKHESKVNSEIDPTCRFCMEDEETAWHVVGQCPAFWKERRDIFKYTTGTRKICGASIKNAETRRNSKPL